MQNEINDKLDMAIKHINVSIPSPIDRETFIACIKGDVSDKKWKYHISTFLLETPIDLMHDIVLEEHFNFEELYRAKQIWDKEGYANGETFEWIKEMYYLVLGKADELGIERFV